MATIRLATPEEDVILRAFFRAMWRDFGESENGFLDDWETAYDRRVAELRATAQHRAYVADDGNAVVGAAQCHVFGGISPPVLRRQRYLYIWGVFVLPRARGRGFGGELTDACVRYGREIECTRAVLHASDMGMPVYERVGFERGREMTILF